MAISEAISLAVKGIDYLIHYEEKQEEKLEELKGAYQDLTSQISSLDDELETARDRIEELKGNGDPYDMKPILFNSKYRDQMTYYTIKE
ncbi:MAG: hypothetical protein LIO87_06820, partial [Eubacterium sp.]|nr:hypothetical protein [Eubacterium sp.]MCC8161225.1 hypothetical protein [Oscillospiraceae bacterium]